MSQILGGGEDSLKEQERHSSQQALRTLLQMQPRLSLRFIGLLRYLTFLFAICMLLHVNSYYSQKVSVGKGASPNYLTLFIPNAMPWIFSNTEGAHETFSCLFLTCIVGILDIFFSFSISCHPSSIESCHPRLGLVIAKLPSVLSLLDVISKLSKAPSDMIILGLWKSSVSPN